MSKKIAFIFPGQGSQYVGMGKDFYDEFSVSREVFDEADRILGYKFSDLMFSGPKEELTLTKNSQLAIYIVSYAIYKAMQERIPTLLPTVCAGLSLGEYTALTVAGKISFKDCLRLVQHRAQFMNDACDTHPGSMSVVLGMEEQFVKEALSELTGEIVSIANLNCPGQIVIAGTKEGLEKATEHLKKKGAKRILPLDVSGAFHSSLMEEAATRLTPFLQAAPLTPSCIELVMNRPGTFVTDLDDMRAQLVAQVSQAVLWEKGVHAMVGSGVDLFVEMGPGKTLAGMNKRIGVIAPTLSIEKIADIEALTKDYTSCNC